MINGYFGDPTSMSTALAGQSPAISALFSTPLSQLQGLSGLPHYAMDAGNGENSDESPLYGLQSTVPAGSPEMEAENKSLQQAETGDIYTLLYNARRKAYNDYTAARDTGAPKNDILDRISRLTTHIQNVRQNPDSGKDIDPSEYYSPDQRLGPKLARRVENNQASTADQLRVAVAHSANDPARLAAIQAHPNFVDPRPYQYWTDQQKLATLQQMAANGQSFGQIAKALGVTRGAVAGKLNRLKNQK